MFLRQFDFSYLILIAKSIIICLTWLLILTPSIADGWGFGGNWGPFVIAGRNERTTTTPPATNVTNDGNQFKDNVTTVFPSSKNNINNNNNDSDGDIAEQIKRFFKMRNPYVRRSKVVEKRSSIKIIVDLIFSDFSVNSPAPFQRWHWRDEYFRKHLHKKNTVSTREKRVVARYAHSFKLLTLLSHYACQPCLLLG